MLLAPKVLAQGLTIPATSGEITIAQSWKLFSGNLDEEVKDWGIKAKGSPTEEMSFQVVASDNHFDFVKQFGVPDDYEVTPHQIVTFCELHAGALRRDGFGTFFIFKDKGSWRVARVRIMFGLMYVLVYYLYNPMQNPFTEATDTIWLVKPE